MAELYMADLNQEVHSYIFVSTKCVQSNPSPDFILEQNLMGPFSIKLKGPSQSVSKPQIKLTSIGR
jgi:hypothetical protein